MEKNMPEKAAPNGGSPRRTLRRTYYDILGVPMGASIDHVKDSYRLLTKKTLMTDVAYRTLTDTEKRRECTAWLLEESKSKAHSQIANTREGQDWGKRGRERCSCGKILEIDDEWNCKECWGRLEYGVVFDMFGGHIVHESELFDVTEADGETPPQEAYSKEAEAFLNS
jgi:hypothetical protein